MNGDTVVVETVPEGAEAAPRSGGASRKGGGAFTTQAGRLASHVRLGHETVALPQRHPLAWTSQLEGFWTRSLNQVDCPQSEAIAAVSDSSESPRTETVDLARKCGGAAEGDGVGADVGPGHSVGNRSLVTKK